MLYQYTNVEALALILSNKTIRFSALNKMDDLQEMQTSDLRNLGQFIFVSCWTDDAAEQIPMWKMYTDLESGVRIKLPKYPFAEVENRPEDFAKMYKKVISDETNGIYIKSLIPFFKMAEGKFITPGLVQQKNILFQMEYTSDREKLYPAIMSSSGQYIHLDLGKLGKYKNKGWEFQREWRYIFIMLPLDLTDIEKVSNNADKTVAEIINGSASLPFSSYDIKINEEAFSQMEIMLSPKLSAGNRVIVRDLVDKYNPSAKIVESAFKGTLA